MRIEHVIQFYKTQAAAAEAIEISPQLMSKLKREEEEEDKRVPTDYQIKWEVASGGALKADLPREIRNPKPVAEPRGTKGKTLVPS